MADTLQIITRTPNATAPTRIVAQKGVRYEIQDPTLNKQGPASLRAKRVGQDLSISFGDNAQADVVVEGFYNPDIMANNPASVYGRGPDDLLYEYFPENNELTDMTAGLVDGASPVSQVLGGSPVAGLVGAEVGALLPVVAAFNPLTAVLIGVGVAAAAGGGGGGGGGGGVTLDTTAPTPTLHSKGRIATTGSSSVSSTEPGTAYLVNSSLTVTSVADILALKESQYNSVSIGTANTATNLAMTGLAAGTYKLYVVDAAGNLSAGTGNTVDVFPAVNLSTVAAGIDGFVINGQSNNDRSGFSVSNAGDVNGDGLSDLIVGAPDANTNAGKSYVVFGKTGPLAIELSSVEQLKRGFVISGHTNNDFSGYSVSNAGDVNGDGLADLIVGAYAANSAAGKSYVVFGQTGTTAIELSLVEQDKRGFVINGQTTADNNGFSVSNAGDVNGDGLADLIVGAKGANGGAGKSYVVFGQTGT